MATYAGHWGPEEFLDRSMRPRADADVYVYTLGTTTAITLYANRAKSATIANPLPKGVGDGTAGLDAKGNGDFYAVPGEYRMVVKVNGSSVFDDTVTVANDQADGGGSGSAIYTDVSASPYSATGSNATTDATAIQAAIDAVAAAGGGTVFFPKLYDVDVPIIAKSNVRFLGHHSAKSGVRRKAGVDFATRAVIESPALGATQIYNVKFERFCIDGNYGQFGQDAFGSGIGSRGLDLVACDTQVEDLWVRNCEDRGVQHSGSSTTTVTQAGNPVASTAWWHNFRVSNCYGDRQFNWDGPTDCQFSDFWIYLPDHPNAPANEGMSFTCSGHEVSQGHIWGESHKVGLYDRSPGNMQYTSMVVESASGSPGNAGLSGSANVVLEGGVKLFHGIVYDNAANHTTKTGIRIGTAAGASCQEAVITAIVSNCARAAVDYANAGEATEVNVLLTPDGATPYVGTPHGNHTFLRTAGGFASTERRMLGGTHAVQQDGASPAIQFEQNAFPSGTAWLLQLIGAGSTFKGGISNLFSYDFPETSTPAALSDFARIYAKARGGITEFVVRCDTGDEQIVASQAGGPVLKAPDSSLWRLVVSNAGVLSTVAYP